MKRLKQCRCIVNYAKKLEELGYKVLTSRDSDIDVDFVTERSRMVNKTNSTSLSVFTSMRLAARTLELVEFKPIPIVMIPIIQVKSTHTGITILTV